MFDIGISELGVIGVVALIVIGPERLPKVARTMGTLIGRAQRYVSEVKTEVSREMQLDELRRMKDSVRDAAQSLESSIHGELQKTEAGLNSAWESAIGGEAAGPEAPPALDEPPTVTPSAAPSSLPSGFPAKQKNWRRNRSAHQSAMPQWFRSVSRKRARVLSGAARVARYRARP